jgi:hypothetical protein
MTRNVLSLLLVVAVQDQQGRDFYCGDGRVWRRSSLGHHEVT